MVHRVGILALSLVLVSCASSPAPANRKEAMAAFAKDAEPEAARTIEGFLFEAPMPLTWTGPAKFGRQDGSNPLDNPTLIGDRIVRDGTLPNGGTFFLEAYYAYKEARIQSITLVVDFPDTRAKKPIGNPPVTKELLSQYKVRPALIEELLKGLGKGSISGGGDLSFEASTEVSGKRVEASTAINRGGPLALELSCTYFR